MMKIEVNLDEDRAEEFTCVKYSIASPESSFPEGTLCIWTDSHPRHQGPQYIFNRNSWESLAVVS